MFCSTCSLPWVQGWSCTKQLKLIWSLTATRSLFLHATLSNPMLAGSPINQFSSLTWHKTSPRWEKKIKQFSVWVEAAQEVLTCASPNLEQLKGWFCCSVTALPEERLTWGMQLALQRRQTALKILSDAQGSQSFQNFPVVQYNVQQKKPFSSSRK